MENSTKRVNWKKVINTSWEEEPLRRRRCIGARIEIAEERQNSIDRHNLSLNQANLGLIQRAEGL
ncbi:hypothetical protein N7471_001560 [Penicillium samsonianum]|uniref:uncharacterized protein n=1 Tax=Penicillium samsonianum TaxID=1882272 RepID=UPI0025487630|nr:uncharacterized protein N7471_001560 [Penicillium samsonianum]KAJ6150361.1 hypothetical protein N7471_001560 [Penicillium samsonianum]